MIGIRFLAILTLTIGFTTPLAPRAQAVSQDIYEKLDVFAHVLDRIRTSYVEDVTETEVIESAINGMLTSLDPHSSYLSSKDFEGLQEQTKGEFGGLGIEVTMEHGLVKVVAPIEDTPAYDAGIESGDLISQIDGENVQGLTLTEAVDKMRGKVGEPIDLHVLRESEKRSLDITIVRAIIKVKPVKSRLEKDGIGYLRITSFNDYTMKSLKEHLSKLKKENKKENDLKSLRGLIIDLRNNPGGLLNQAISVADAFLEKGEIVSTRGRIKNQNSRYTARAGDKMNGKPIVVLINGGSASASEIVAGALQDHKRAIVLGTKSFGKDSVQTVMHLPGGAGMRLTTALYYTPSGTSIQAKGIEPDIEVKPLKNLAEVDTNGYPSEAKLNGHIELDKKKKDKKDKKKPSKKNKKNDDKKRTSADAVEGKITDYQLERALDVIKALSLWRKDDK